MWSPKKYIQDELAAAAAADLDPTCATPDTMCTCGAGLFSIHRDSVRPLALLVFRVGMVCGLGVAALVGTVVGMFW